jgi:hypothetical protein
MPSKEDLRRKLYIGDAIIAERPLQNEEDLPEQ